MSALLHPNESFFVGPSPFSLSTAPWRTRPGVGANSPGSGPPGFFLSLALDAEMLPASYLTVRK